MTKNITETTFGVPKPGTLRKTEEDRQNNLYVLVEQLDHMISQPAQSAPKVFAKEFDKDLRALLALKLEVRRKREALQSNRELSPDEKGYSQTLELFEGILAVAVDFATLTTNVTVTDGQ